MSKKEIRLQRITELNSNASVIFNYNQSGLLIKESYSSNNSIPITKNDFIYSINSVLQKPFGIDPLMQQTEIYYLTDADNKPLQRNSTESLFFNPPEGPQFQFHADSTAYIYDQSGYLIQYNGRLIDSISYYPLSGVLELQNNIVIYSATNEMQGGNLKKIKRNFQLYAKVANSGITNEARKTAEETIDFSYDKKYPNQFDFVNVYLFQGLNVLPFPLYSYDKKYINYPNKAVITRIVKDINGNIIKTETLTEEPSLTFDSKGYIRSYLIDSSGIKQIFEYSNQ